MPHCSSYRRVYYRAAYKWWSESVDALLGIANALHDWQTALTGSVDAPADLLKRCGPWGCLLAAVVSSNIAQYVSLYYCLVRDPDYLLA